MSLHEPKVSVLMITYKHEKYIKQAIEGVLMQDCDFEVELIIADDHSPDNTEQIVGSFIQCQTNSHRINYTKHEKNKGMLPNFLWAITQCKGKYIAFCEGDDYWIDPLKLQKQVDFLEENNDFGVIHTDFDKCDVNSNLIKRECVSKKSINNKWIENHNPFEEIIRGTYSICTATSMFKRELLEYFDFNLSKDYKQGDLSLWLTFSQHTKFGFIKDSTSAYRIMEESASKSKDKNKLLEFNLSSRKLRYFFAKKYSNNTELITYASDTYNRSKLIKAFNQFNTSEGYDAFNNLSRKTLQSYVFYYGSKYKILHVFFNKIKIVSRLL